jgi:hypothetical protein
MSLGKFLIVRNWNHSQHGVSPVLEIMILYGNFAQTDASHGYALGLSII